jgi:hypothetical protein
MKHLFFISCLLIFIFDFCEAQVEVTPKTKDENYINSYVSNEAKYNANIKNVSYKEIQGSPYLIDSFVVGSIYTNRNEKFQNIPVRYNIYTENIEYIVGAGSVLELKNPETVENIEYGDYKLIYLSQSNKNKLGNGFFIVLTEGNATLLSKPGVTLHKPTQTGGYIDAQPPSFSRNPDTYYIKIGTNPANILRNKRQLITSFPDYREELRNYIKSNNTKISDQKSLINLVQYYNFIKSNIVVR